MRKLEKLTNEQLGRTNPVIPWHELQLYLGGSAYGDTGYLSPQEQDRLAKEQIVDYICMHFLCVDPRLVTVQAYTTDTLAHGKCQSLNGNFIGILINQNSNLFQSGNEYDTALCIIHELQHANSLANAGTPQSELEAYYAMQDSPYFNYASVSYKDHILSQIVKYYNRVY